MMYIIMASLLLQCTHKPEPEVVTIIDDPTTDTLPLKLINTSIEVGAPVEASFKNDTYFNIIKKEFSTGEALWYPNWGGWTGIGEYDFTEFNKSVNWLVANKLKPTAHMLVGQDLFMPEWLVELKSPTPQYLDSLMHNLIDTIMEANDNKNKVEIWNVANELFDDDGTYRTNMVLSKMGWEQDSSNLTDKYKINDKHPIFIRKAFEYCRTKTSKKLELRDFNIESPNPEGDNFNYKKNLAIYQLLVHMLNTKVPVDAIGIQGHLQLGKYPWRTDNNILSETVSKFKQLGLEVYITELDISIEDNKWSPEVANQQRDAYHNYIQQALEGGATRISFWGVQDGMDKSWLTDKYPLPWAENFVKKPAYFGVHKALMETKNK